MNHSCRIYPYFILFLNELLYVVVKNVDHVRRKEENGYLHDLTSPTIAYNLTVNIHYVIPRDLHWCI